MNADEYRAYLRSPWWRHLRDFTLEDRGHRCEACGSAHRLEVHHRSYERLGAELPEHLVVLCRHCHELVHETQHDRRIRLAEATDLVTATATPNLIFNAVNDRPIAAIQILSTVIRQLDVRYANSEARLARESHD